MSNDCFVANHSNGKGTILLTLQKWREIISIRGETRVGIEKKILYLLTN